jgi:flavin reductase (DIM6/NTAB) family NADH-FMN oxidoreductase RutF
MRRSSEMTSLQVEARSNGPAIQELRQALRCFVTGVTVVTGLNRDGTLVGMTAQFVHVCLLRAPACPGLSRLPIALVQWAD